ncbi:MAG: F0F1 ATP synthase subunit delta [Arcobacteraceae bacterium]
MIDLVAKRYVKALMSDRDNTSLTAVYNELKEISTAFADEKFLLIISSTEVESSKKVELILSFIDKCSESTTNLVKLLGDNKRLSIIPMIVNELESELSVLNNSFKGVIYTNEELEQSDVDTINSQFAKKFNVDLELTQNICDYNGVKVSIDGLGVEVGFAKSRLKSQMIDHILKAV